jgi:hypothetical protein
MLCTDSLEDLAALQAVKSPKRIPTKNINVVYRGYLIPKLFEPNRCFCATLRPQERSTLSTRRNPRVLPLRSLAGIQNEIASDFQESNWIRHAVDHKCRERFGSI